MYGVFQTIWKSGGKKIESFDIFTVGNLQNIFMEHDLYLMS